MDKKQRTYRVFSVIFLLLIIFNSAPANAINAFEKCSDIHKSKDATSTDNSDETDGQQIVKAVKQPAVITTSVDVQKDSYVIEEINLFVILEEEYFEYSGFQLLNSYYSNLFSSTIRVNAP